MILYITSIFGLTLSMIWFKITRRNYIRDEPLLIILYFITGYIGLFGFQILSQFILFDKVEWSIMATRHALNIVLGLVVLMIARRQEDFLVDMEKYLLKQIKERQQEGQV